jgi:hypothetical protein
MFLPVLGHLKLGNGDKVWLVPSTTVTLGRQHVRIHPAAAAVARCQCEVSASHSGVVHATSKGTNPTAVSSPAGQRLLRQGVRLCLLAVSLVIAELHCIAYSAPLVHLGKAHGQKCHLSYWSHCSDDCLVYSQRRAPSCAMTTSCCCWRATLLTLSAWTWALAPGT